MTKDALSDFDSGSTGDGFPVALILSPLGLLFSHFQCNLRALFVSAPKYLLFRQMSLPLSRVISNRHGEEGCSTINPCTRAHSHQNISCTHHNTMSKSLGNRDLPIVWNKARVRKTCAGKKRRSQATEGSGLKTFTVWGTKMPSFSTIVYRLLKATNVATTASQSLSNSWSASPAQHRGGLVRRRRTDSPPALRRTSDHHPVIEGRGRSC